MAKKENPSLQNTYDKSAVRWAHGTLQDPTRIIFLKYKLLLLGTLDFQSVGVTAVFVYYNQMVTIVLMSIFLKNFLYLLSWSSTFQLKKSLITTNNVCYFSMKRCAKSQVKCRTIIMFLSHLVTDTDSERQQQIWDFIFLTPPESQTRTLTHCPCHILARLCNALF